MRERLDSMAAADTSTDVGLLLADLETAYEELRVADEEVRAQQDHIAQLTERENLVRWQQERMLAVLPVPVLTTDRVGVVRSVNAAAAGLLERRVSRLVGKPLLTLVATDDRPDLRRFLGSVHEEGESLRRVVTLLHRDAPAESVELQATVLPGAVEISWLVLSGHDPVRPQHAAHRLAPALVELIRLPARGGTTADVLRESARICSDALGAGASVSVTIGNPLAPDALATSDELAQACDGAQAAAGEGPCVAAYETGETVVCADVHADDRRDDRWSRFVVRAPDQLRAVVAAPTDLGNQRLGALNVYLAEPAPSPTLVEGVELMAAAIGSATYEIGLRDEIAGLSGDMERALASRATIDQAKGIVMAARRCTPDEAFAHLADLASTRHVKLRELAAQIVAGAASA